MQLWLSVLRQPLFGSLELQLSGTDRESIIAAFFNLQFFFAAAKLINAKLFQFGRQIPVRTNNRKEIRAAKQHKEDLIGRSRIGAKHE